MTPSNPQPIIKVFDKYERAIQTVRDLEQLGIDARHYTISVNAARSPVEILTSHQMTTDELFERLTSEGVASEDARYYAEELQAGRTILTVDAGELRTDVNSLLRRHAPDQESMEIREERLVVKKETREVGEVRVRKIVEEVPAKVETEVTHDQVDIEHVAVNEVVAERRAPWQENDILIVPVYEERPVVVTELVLREYVRIHHRKIKEQRTVEDTILRERAIAQEIDAAGNVLQETALDTDSNDQPTNSTKP